jgi:hypothetical protein
VPDEQGSGGRPFQVAIRSPNEFLRKGVRQEGRRREGGREGGRVGGWEENRKRTTTRYGGERPAFDTTQPQSA